MIKDNTVLILGAGASADYNYPTGLKLKDDIVRNLAPGSNNYWLEIFDIVNIRREEIQEFTKALSHCGLDSIDTFLERNPKYHKIGVLAIAIGITRKENAQENGFFRTDRYNWYQYLYGKLDAPFDDFENNRLSIITFNYDRSLEHCLFTYFRNTHLNKSIEECAQKFMTIPIIHVYGKLGNLPWQDNKDTREYTNFSDEIQGVIDVSKNIKILSERDTISEDFRKAHKLLFGASKIIFMGWKKRAQNLFLHSW